VGPPVDFKASGPCRLLPIALPHRSDSRLYGYVMKPPEVSTKRPPQLAASNSRTPGPFQLRKHTEVTCRAAFAYSAYGPTYPFQMPTAGHECAALASGHPAGRTQFQFLCVRRLPRLHPASFHPQGNRKASRRGLTPQAVACPPGHRPTLSSLLYSSPGTDSAAVRNRTGSCG
jgi:hypothetical protein